MLDSRSKVGLLFSERQATPPYVECEIAVNPTHLEDQAGLKDLRYVQVLFNCGLQDVF